MNMENNSERAEKDTFSLEEAFEELDNLIASMKNDIISLEESFASYQKGMELLKKCNDQIDLIEKKVELLNADGTRSVSEELSDVR